MKSSTKDQAEGTFHKVKGKIKEIAGKNRPGQEGFGEVVRAACPAPACPWAPTAVA